jgi:hypothetical protein
MFFIDEQVIEKKKRKFRKFWISVHIYYDADDDDTMEDKDCKRRILYDSFYSWNIMLNVRWGEKKEHIWMKKEFMSASSSIFTEHSEHIEHSENVTKSHFSISHGLENCEKSQANFNKMNFFGRKST